MAPTTMRDNLSIPSIEVYPKLHSVEPDLRPNFFVVASKVVATRGGGGGGGGGTLIFSSYVGSGPASTVSEISSTPKIFEILATPQNITHSVA